MVRGAVTGAAVPSDGDVADPGEPEGRSADGTLEALVGMALVAVVLLFALLVRYHPGPTSFDRWGFSLIHPAPKDVLYRRVSELRAIPFVAGGSILAALVVVGRDRLRALSCLVGPIIAVLVVEYVLKPIVDRRYEVVLTFPSGTTTVVASVATAWVIAVPVRLRSVAVVVGAFVVALECIAVVALQWHYPSDAVCGAIFGIGTVLLIDGLLHGAAASLRAHRAAPSDGGTRGAPDSVSGRPVG